MNIAFVINQLIVGGAEQYVITKSEGLIKKGYNVIVVSEGGIWVKELPSMVRHYELKGLMESPYNFTKKGYKEFIYSLSNILIDNKIDIIEGQNTWPIIHVINSYQIHKIPYYMNILSELSYDRNPILQSATRLLSEQNLYYVLTKKMNSYIKERCRKDLQAKIINIPIQVKSNIEIEDYHYVLSVCRMSPEKMYVKSLIKGFSELIIKNKHIKHNLVIVGDGILFHEISELANTENERIGEERIIIKGTVVGDELINLFSKCSLYIGMGITLLKAASLHKACIRCGFEPKTMNMAWGFWGDDEEADKDEIVYVDSSNHSEEEDFQSIIRRSINDPNLLFNKGEKAYKLFTEYYSFEQIINKWDQEYKNIKNSNNQSELFKISKNTESLSNRLRLKNSLFLLKKILLKWKKYYLSSELDPRQ